MVADFYFRYAIAWYISMSGQITTIRRNPENRNCATPVCCIISTGCFSIFQEQFSISKLLGIGLGIVAVISLLFGQHFQEKTTSDHKKGLVFLLSVWIGYALVDILLKYTTGLGLQFALALNLAFLFSFVLSSSFLVLQKNRWSQKNILAGSGLGLLNFCNIALYIKAHMLLKDSPAIVFAGMNILVVLLGVMSGLLYFKEKLNLPTLIGLILGLTGVICLAYAM